MRPLRPIIPFDAAVQHPVDDLLLQRRQLLEVSQSPGMFAVAFFLALHFQDHRTQVGGRLLEDFILVGISGDDVRDVGYPL